MAARAVARILCCVEATALTVAVGATVTALATGLGALPFAFVHPGRRWVGMANAAAAGFMFAASIALLVEGVRFGGFRTAIGVLAGAAFIALTRSLLHDRDLALGSMRGVDARKAVVIVAAMTAHSLTEGIGVGVSFGGGETLGLVITLAIAIHNIPEGLAISLVLVPRGASVPTAAWWSVFSSLPQPLVAVPAFLFVDVFASFLPLGLGFAAGAMTWLALTELVPDARGSGRRAALAGALSFAAMMALQGALLLL
jgi:zinc transporter ZupT